MALQDSVQLTEPVKLLRSEIAAFAKRTVQRRRRMAFGEYEAVPVGILLILKQTTVNE